MIKKIKEYFVSRKQYKEAKKAVTLMIMNQYSDLLVAETEAHEAEKKAYEQFGDIGTGIDMDEFSKLAQNIDKIANDPELTTAYYKAVHDDAQKEKNLKVVK